MNVPSIVSLTDTLCLYPKGHVVKCKCVFNKEQGLAHKVLYIIPGFYENGKLEKGNPEIVTLENRTLGNKLDCCKIKFRFGTLLKLYEKMEMENWEIKYVMMKF